MEYQAMFKGLTVMRRGGRGRPLFRPGGFGPRYRYRRRPCCCGGCCICVLLIIVIIIVFGIGILSIFLP